MAKPRKPINDYAVFLIVRLVVCVLQALSLTKARSFASFLGWLAFRIDRRHREVARENLRHAYPDLSAKKIEDYVRAMYEHFATVLVEIVQIPRRLHANNWQRFMKVIHGERMINLLSARRPTLIVMGHFGNWEMAGYTMGMFGFRLYAIARRIDNRHLDRFLARFRSGTGQTILDKNDDYERIQQVLREGGAIAMLADQDAGPRGTFVDFFGRPASTFKSIALLALEFNAAIIVVGVPKVGEPMRYHLSSEDVILPEDFANEKDPAKAITQRYTAALERIIRQAPGQYFWLHRRWKHQPPVRKSRAA